MIWVLLVIVLSALIVMERKGTIDTEEFSVAIVFVLTGFAAYLGLR
jgi:hypothetical protein